MKTIVEVYSIEDDGSPAKGTKDSRSVIPQGSTHERDALDSVLKKLGADLARAHPNVAFKYHEHAAHK